MLSGSDSKGVYICEVEGEDALFTLAASSFCTSACACSTFTLKRWISRSAGADIAHRGRSGVSCVQADVPHKGSERGVGGKPRAVGPRTFRRLLDPDDRVPSARKVAKQPRDERNRPSATTGISAASASRNR